MRLPIALLGLALLACHPRPDRPARPGEDMAMYTVQWGDTLEWIAWDFEVPGGWPALARLNSLPDPDYITMGQRLRIPRSGVATEGLPPWPAMAPVEAPPKACSAERAPPPRPTPVQGCASSACVPLEGGRWQVCSCEAIQGSSGFVWMEAGRPLQAWPAPVHGRAGDDPSQVFGTARDFDVVQADLDGDGRREHLVAFRREQNDLGMSWWNLAVLSGARPGAPPLLLTAANYGEGSLIRSREGRGCDLLSTTWELAWEPGRLQSGWTLLGRPMRYRDGALEPLRQQPILARRRYHSFQPGSVTLPGGLTVGTPARDLSHPKAHERVIEPLAQRWRLYEEPMMVMGATPQRHGELGTVLGLDVALSGVAHRLEWQGWDEGYHGIGERVSGRLFPPGYLPAAQGWPATHAGSMSSYSDAYGNLQPLLWLD
jgi:hypothetical protein